MPLTHLDITDFRNLAKVTLSPSATGFNVIYGLNGSGKTSLLEAIYYLSLGRSFRSHLTGRIIRHSADKFQIFAQKTMPGEQSVPVGIERQAAGTIKIRIAGQDVQSLAELANVTPIQLIHSDCFNLLDGGPGYRRKFLDWGIFYLNPDFFRVWRDVAQIVKQRNAALRQRRPKAEIVIWTDKLAHHAVLLDTLRQQYVDQLLPVLTATVAELIAIPDLKIQYYAGWDKTKSYQAVLDASIDKDLQLGYTQFGPHRADFKIQIQHVNAKDILSRGQQKLFVCAMILAQGALLRSGTNKKPIYLIDDLPAELDTVSRSNLIALLSKQETQIFVTAVERAALSEGLLRSPTKMFHVEHGDVTEVV